MSTARQKKVRSDLNIQLLVKREAKFKKVCVSPCEETLLSLKIREPFRHMKQHRSSSERKRKPHGRPNTLLPPAQSERGD